MDDGTPSATIQLLILRRFLRLSTRPACPAVYQKPFLSDVRRVVREDPDIAEYTDPINNPMIPRALGAYAVGRGAPGVGGGGGGGGGANRAGERDDDSGTCTGSSMAFC